MEEYFSSVFRENAGYVEDMFARYSTDPNSVGIEWRTYFEGFHEGFSVATNLAKNTDHFFELLEILSESPGLKQGTSRTPATEGSLGAENLIFEFKVIALVQAWKSQGHLLAKVDPLGQPPKPVSALSLEA